MIWRRIGVVLVFVLLICGLGVMEIHSATVHTKFAGAHIKQVYWIAGGVAGMFLARRAPPRRVPAGGRSTSPSNVLPSSSVTVI